MKRKSTYTLLAIIFWASVFAQVPQQIQQNSSSYKSNSYQQQKYIQRSLLDIYLDSARYYSGKEPLKAVEYINKAIEESIKTNNSEKEAQAFLILGDIQQNLGQADLAIENYKKCLSALAENRKKKLSTNSPEKSGLRFQASKKMATAYVSLNDLKQAGQWISTAIDNYGYAVNDKEVLDAKRVLAEIALKKENVKEAKEVLNAVLAEEQKNKNSAGEVSTLLLLGKAAQQEGNENQAIVFYTQAKDISQKYMLPELTLKANGALAGVYRSQKKVDKEIQARNANIQINNSLNNSTANSIENIEIGNAYLNANQTQQAETYFNKGNQQITSKEIQLNSTKIPPQKELFSISAGLEKNADAYKTLAEKYRKEGDYEKAMLYFRSYAELQDSVKAVRERELTEALAISTNIGKNQQRIDLLEKEKDLNSKSIDILKQDKKLKEEQLGFQNTIIISLSVVVFLMLLAVVLIMRSSKEKKKVHQLLALKSLRGQMNPHFIFNALNSVNHYVSQNDERKANRYLSDFSRLMRLVMDSSRHDFIPLTEELEMLGLYLQLEHARFSDKFEYTVHVDDGLEESEWMIPPMLIQPYLENAVWHGLRYIEGKGMLSLNIGRKENELIIVVADNGIGRKKSAEVKTLNQKKQHSLGMQNIENRIKIMNELFGTRISVAVTDNSTNEVNCGTKVSIVIPQKTNTHA